MKEKTVNRKTELEFIKKILIAPALRLGNGCVINVVNLKICKVVVKCTVLIKYVHKDSIAYINVKKLLSNCCR